MISLIGFSSLCLSTIFSFVVLIPYSILKINVKYLLFIFRSSTILICISFVSLIFAYVTSDFSNFNVFQNSHSNKPLIYKITGAWGNHEGSILLWICMISIYGFFYSIFAKSVNNFKDYTGIEYIASMNQTHSDVVTFVKSSAVYDSDGIYTEEPKLGLVVQTADCMPILLSDKKRIGAIHSGWRGLKNNILEKAIRKFDVNELSISIGPHAQSCCYEVKEDVKKYFNDYTELRDGMFFLNMSKALKDLSEKEGFQVEVSSICTICNSSYNSYRENKTTARQFGVIWK